MHFWIKQSDMGQNQQNNHRGQEAATAFGTALQRGLGPRSITIIFQHDVPDWRQNSSGVPPTCVCPSLCLELAKLPCDKNHVTCGD